MSSSLEAAQAAAQTNPSQAIGAALERTLSDDCLVATTRISADHSVSETVIGARSSAYFDIPGIDLVIREVLEIPADGPETQDPSTEKTRSLQAIVWPGVVMELNFIVPSLPDGQPLSTLASYGKATHHTIEEDIDNDLLGRLPEPLLVADSVRLNIIETLSLARSNPEVANQTPASTATAIDSMCRIHGNSITIGIPDFFTKTSDSKGFSLVSSEGMGINPTVVTKAMVRNMVTGNIEIVPAVESMTHGSAQLLGWLSILPDKKVIVSGPNTLHPPEGINNMGDVSIIHVTASSPGTFIEAHPAQQLAGYEGYRVQGPPAPVRSSNLLHQLKDRIPVVQPPAPLAPETPISPGVAPDAAAPIDAPEANASSPPVTAPEPAAATIAGAGPKEAEGVADDQAGGSLVTNADGSGGNGFGASHFTDNSKPGPAISAALQAAILNGHTETADGTAERHYTQAGLFTEVADPDSTGGWRRRKNDN